MKLIASHIYVTIPQIADACGLSYSSITTMLSRRSPHWQSIPDPDDRRQTLVLYHTLPAQHRQAISNHYCQGLHPRQWLENHTYSDTLIIQQVLHAYEDYIPFLRHYQDVIIVGNPDKTHRSKEYLARAASCITAAYDYYTQSKTPLSDRSALRQLAAYLREHKSILFPKGFSYLKTSERHLHKALKDLKTGKSISQIVSLPRRGNDNSLGADHAYIKGAVARLITTGKNPTIASVVRSVRYLCTSQGINPPSESTIYNMVSELNAVTALKRFGDTSSHAAAQRFSIPTAMAISPGDCWEMDGTRVQLQPFFNTDGKVEYLYLVAIRDVYSGSFLGWSFALAESGLMYREALKMAVSLTGYLPYELRYDRFPGHKSDETLRLFDAFQAKGCKLTKTSKSTGKAHIERSFGTLQSVFEADLKNWVGQGIMSSRHFARPTAEYLKKVHDQLKKENFSWEEAWRQENRVISLYNATPLSLYSKKYKHVEQSPLELHQDEKPNVIPVQLFDISELFWDTRKVKIRNYSVTITVNRLTYIYMLTDDRFYHIVREHKDLLVKYDASDMSSVMLFDSLYGNFIDTAQLYNPIQVYGPSAELGRLAEERQKQKQLKTKINEDLQHITDHCDDDVLNIQIAHMLPKEAAMQAESSAYAKYWPTNVPVSVELTPKKETKKANQESADDPLANILNQL